MLRILLACLLLSGCSGLGIGRSGVSALPLALGHVMVLQASAPPALPDSLEGRPRKQDDDTRGVSTPEAVDEALEKTAEVAHLRWFFANGLAKYHIVIASSPNCPPCRAADEQDYPELVRRHWYIYKFDVSRSPALAEWLDVDVTPTVIAFVDGREVGRIEGRASASQITKLFAAHRASAAQPQLPEKIVGGKSVSCRQYRGLWTWPGGTIESLRVHLTQPPHNLPAERVAEMSPGACIQWHDDWHQRNGSVFVVGGRRR